MADEQVTSEVPELLRQSVVVACAGLTLLVNSLCLYCRTQAWIPAKLKPLYAVRQSLFVGGVLLAVSYLVEAYNVFTKTNGSPCLSFFFISKYEQEIYPFIFGSGLVLQGFFLILSFVQDLNESSGSLNRQCVWAALPWVLASAIVCPLVFIGVQVEGSSCLAYSDRGTDRWVELISVVVPAIFAVIFAIVVFLIRPKQTEGMNVYSIRLPRMTCVPAIAIPGEEKVDKVPFVISHRLEGFSSQEDHHQCMEKKTHDSISTIGYRGAQLPNAPHLVKSLKLVSTFVIAIVVFVVSVIPYSAFVIYSSGLPTTSKTLTLLESFNWIKHIYPILIPIIWIRNIKPGCDSTTV